MAQEIPGNEDHRCIASDRVEGTKVYNPEGEKLGTVLNFMVDKRSGQARYAVMEFGGVLGMGSEYYPIPWDMLDYDESVGGYVVDIAKDKLEGAPRHKDRHSFWDDVYGQQVYSYYGLPFPYF
jgi:hypothetical protein